MYHENQRRREQSGTQTGAATTTATATTIDESRTERNVNEIVEIAAELLERSKVRAEDEHATYSTLHSAIAGCDVIGGLRRTI